MGLYTRTFKLNRALLFAECRQQPWESMDSGFDADPPIPSMISIQERKFLLYLTRTTYSGRGAIIDMGPLAGASTYAMAAGMSCGRIYCYDLWQYCPGWEQFVDGQALAIGSDIMAWFQKNIRPFSHLITACKGNILDQRWLAGPIEIIFIDAAKTPAVMRHIANEFFPHLAPGAFVIQQDYVSAECPWLHVAMGQLAEHFEAVDSPEGGTVCFRLTRPLADQGPILADDFSIGPDAGAYISREAQRLTTWRALCVELALARHELIQGNRNRASEIVRRVESHPDFNFQVEYDLQLVKSLIEKNQQSVPGFG
jgi:hypothetical protein